LGAREQDAEALLTDELRDQAAHLRLAADVDALRRLLQEEEPRSALDDARERELLLVAARELARERADAGAANAERVGVGARDPPLVAAFADAGAGERSGDGEGDVVEHAPLRHDRRVPSVGRHELDAG